MWSRLTGRLLARPGIEPSASIAQPLCREKGPVGRGHIGGRSGGCLASLGAAVGPLSRGEGFRDQRACRLQVSAHRSELDGLRGGTVAQKQARKHRARRLVSLELVRHDGR